MTDRPILFSGPMVRALLEGRKTQTRRVLKIPSKGEYVRPDMGGWAVTTFGGAGVRLKNGTPVAEKPAVWNQTTGTTVAPVYDIGDRLWVRERYAKAPPHGVRYAATDAIHDARKQHPSIHMPRWASRLTLIVTDVRVQRLHAIDDADARAEGIIPLPSGRYHCGYDEEGEITCKSPVTAFGWLWNGINGKRPGCHWQDAPWVVALTFTIHRCNIDELPPAAIGDGGPVL